MHSLLFFALSAFIGTVCAQDDPQKSLKLDPSQVQPGLSNDGQDTPEAGQVPSLTSTNNFINFCLTQKGVPLTNGAQVKGGSCNPTPMGRIISTSNMPRSKFIFPANGDTSLVEKAPFTIKMAIENLETGNFVNAASNYYAAPAQVNDQGILIGHSHVVVQAMQSLGQTTILDPAVFSFFKGLNAKDNNGVLTADVTAGLPAGVYRLSSINAAANHQPALVSVAQHGCLDDFVYFTVNKAGAGKASNVTATTETAANVTATKAPVGSPVAAPSTTTAAAAAPVVTNLQVFTGSLGGIKPNPIAKQGTQFVTGGRTFVELQDAITDSCNSQRNSCADKAGQTNGAGGVTITTCDTQQQACLALSQTAGDAGAKNLQTFTGKLGDVLAPSVTASNGTFAVSGRSFPNLIDAINTSCDNQRNLCADKGNAVQFTGGVTIAACDKQQSDCRANAAKVKQ